MAPDPTFAFVGEVYSKIKHGIIKYHATVYLEFVDVGADQDINTLVKRNECKSARQDRPVSKVVLVYFLGGCTHSEITALRFLGKLNGYVFIIATTAIINSATMLESVMERPPI